jgi:hypothetical protein
MRAHLHLTLAALCALSACKSSKPAEHELTAEEFRELLAKGTIEPVREMDAEDRFAGLESGMDPTPEDLSKLATERPEINVAPPVREK